MVTKTKIEVVLKSVTKTFTLCQYLGLPTTAAAPDSAWPRRISRLTRDGTAEPASRLQIHRRERGQRKGLFSLFSWRRAELATLPAVDPYSASMCDDREK